MTTNRIQWVDFAKGISIILVVLHHSIVIEPDSSLYNESLVYFNNLLVYIRMPLFFFLSGLFVHKALNSKFEFFFKFKLVHLLYLYILWILIPEIPKILINRSGFNFNIIDLFIDPPRNWFILALFVFILISRLTKSIPLITLGISLFFFVSSILSGDYEFVDRLMRFYPYYLLGHLTSKYAHKLSENTRLYHVLYLPVYFATVILAIEFELAETPIGISTLFIGGIIAGIIAGSLLSRVPSFSWLSYVGRNTLPIYLIHTIPIGVLRGILPSIIPEQAIVATALMLIIGTTIPLIVFYISNRLGMTWIFNVPFKRKQHSHNYIQTA